MDKPILFSGPMVRAILEGNKTATRRVVKPQPDSIRKSPFVPSGIEDNHGREIKAPYQPGDHLWVRETWGSNIVKGYEEYGKIFYRADIPDQKTVPQTYGCPWRPSIHMPRWASRITLDVTAVRAERLQEITEEDAIREGLTGITKDGKLVKYGIPDRDGLPGTDNTGWAWQDWCVNPIDALARLWDSINGKTYPWKDNPWVWVIEFKKEKICR